jgi:hypothetical protein
MYSMFGFKRKSASGAEVLSNKGWQEKFGMRLTTDDDIQNVCGKVYVKDKMKIGATMFDGAFCPEILDGSLKAVGFQPASADTPCNNSNNTQPLAEPINCVGGSLVINQCDGSAPIDNSTISEVSSAIQGKCNDMERAPDIGYLFLTVGGVVATGALFCWCCKRLFPGNSVNSGPAATAPNASTRLLSSEAKTETNTKETETKTTESQVSISMVPVRSPNSLKI